MRLLSALGRKRIAFVGKAAVTTITLWLIVRQLDPGSVLAAVNNFRPFWLFSVAAAVVAQFGLVVWRWQTVLFFLKCDPPPFRDLARYLGSSYFYGQVLPSSLGGDIIRAWLVVPFVGWAAAMRSVICDRALGLATLVVMTFLLLPLFAETIDSGWPFHSLAFASTSGSVALMLALLMAPRLRSQNRYLAWCFALLRDLREVLYCRKRRSAILISSFGCHLLSGLIAYSLARTIGADLGLVNCMLLIPPIMFVTTLPISIGGWGVREQAFAAGFLLVGAPTVDSVLTSILFGLTTPLTGFLCLLLSLLTQGPKPPTGSPPTGQIETDRGRY